MFILILCPSWAVKVMPRREKVLPAQRDCDVCLLSRAEPGRAVLPLLAHMWHIAAYCTYIFLLRKPDQTRSSWKSHKIRLPIHTLKTLWLVDHAWHALETKAVGLSHLLQLRRLMQETHRALGSIPRQRARRTVTCPRRELVHERRKATVGCLNQPADCAHDEQAPRMPPIPIREP